MCRQEICDGNEMTVKLFSSNGWTYSLFLLHTHSCFVIAFDDRVNVQCEVKLVLTVINLEGTFVVI